MRKNSKQKGNRGERELVTFLKDFGFQARRTQQYCGNTGDAADVVSTSLPMIHFESKRVQQLAIYTALEQAIEDSGKKDPNIIPVVAHRKNHKPWIAILPLEDLLLILKHSGYYEGN